jgi:hypothetical protein
MAELETPAPAATAAPIDAAPAAPVDVPKPAEADNFNALLSQFDSETAKPAELATAAPDTSSQPTTSPANPEAEVAQVLRDLSDKTVDERVQREIAQREFLRQEHEAGMKIVSDDARELSKEFGDVSEQLLDWFYSAKFSADNRLAPMFYNRNRDAQSARTWKIVHGRLLNEIRRELTSRPDREATEDRAMVAAAVRGAAGHAPAEPAPKFGNMSAAEFGKYTRDNFGF